MRSYGFHISCAAEDFARQHCQSLFTVSVAGSLARLYRWDRSGCIVTEAFDLHENPDAFAEFLWGFSQVSEAGRGHDITVRMGSLEEEVIFRIAIRYSLRSQLEVSEEELDQAIVAHYHPNHVTVIRVDVDNPGPPTTRSRFFLVSRPVVFPRSLDGRGTRGYWAVDTATKPMRDALAKDSRIHKDLCVCDVVLVKEPGNRVRRDYLIGWDASDRVNEKDESLQTGRVAKGRHTFNDDMEALIYVIFYCASLYLPHGLDMVQLTDRHRDFFDNCERVSGVLRGGPGKLANVLGRDWTGTVGFQSAACVEWLATVSDFRYPAGVATHEHEPEPDNRSVLKLTFGD
ncbi:hypothetical protein BN946_scf184847.g8 [Trametes cinnabarina]|uniref:Fungal-type protein kinase domain-containing protein n=1 Tax=Pycnoporus cinnabarinus TaxID=5643 RepID=A0A060SJW8_PYCCI|nr:hypothetical protein BN946_scf184847.g8 [Trametes cinnabarina]